MGPHLSHFPSLQAVFLLVSLLANNARFPTVMPELNRILFVHCLLLGDLDFAGHCIGTRLSDPCSTLVLAMLKMTPVWTLPALLLGQVGLAVCGTFAAKAVFDGKITKLPPPAEVSGSKGSKHFFYYLLDIDFSSKERMRGALSFSISYIDGDSCTKFGDFLRRQCWAGLMHANQ